MLRNTFCHLPGVGPTREKNFWGQGILTWEMALDRLDPSLKKNKPICKGLEESIHKFSQGDSRYFENLLPAGQLFRLFKAFRQGAVFLDIETTGLSPWDKITTIALYDGTQVRHYVQGKNLDEFPMDIKEYSLIVTFNGKTFDLPFIRNRLNHQFDQAHIDLRYVLSGLGYKGGLKKCEKMLGIDRGDLEGVDGSFAIVLWDEYKKSGNPKALETLLAYNVEDVINLEQLMVLAYNMRLEEMGLSGELPAPATSPNPFSPDMALVDRLRTRAFARPW